MTASTSVKPLTQAWIGRDVKVQAAGDVKVSATASTAEGDANSTSAGGGAVNVGVAYATLDVEPTVNAWIGGGTTSVKAGGNVSVTGELKQAQNGTQLTDDLKHSDVNVATDEIKFTQPPSTASRPATPSSTTPTARPRSRWRARKAR